MTRTEYLAALRSLLDRLPAQEQDAALRYYEEYFDEAASDEEAVRQLGTPEQAAARILSDYDAQNVTAQPLPAPVQEAPRQKKKPDTLTVVGIVILCIFASPLLITVAAVLLSACLALIAAIVSPLLALDAVFVSGFFVLFYLSWSISGLFLPGAIFLAGLALLSGALGILTCVLTVRFFHALGKLVRRMIDSIKHRKGAAQA